MNDKTSFRDKPVRSFSTIVLEELEKLGELPPQGSTPEKLEDTESRIIKFIDESENWETIEIGTDVATLTYQLHAADFDKHMLDGLMWEIHTALSRASYPAVAGVSVQLNLHIARDHPRFEDQPAAEELQGVANED